MYDRHTELRVPVAAFNFWRLPRYDLRNRHRSLPFLGPCGVLQQPLHRTLALARCILAPLRSLAITPTPTFARARRGAKIDGSQRSLHPELDTSARQFLSNAKAAPSYLLAFPTLVFQVQLFFGSCLRPFCVVSP